jgi:hypothetical protein
MEPNEFPQSIVRHVTSKHWRGMCLWSTREVSPLENGVGYVSPLENGVGYVSPLENGVGYVSPLENGVGYVSPLENGVGKRSVPTQ